jgi:hypothetical protein
LRQPRSSLSHHFIREVQMKKIVFAVFLFIYFVPNAPVFAGTDIGLFDIILSRTDLSKSNCGEYTCTLVSNDGVISMTLQRTSLVVYGLDKVNLRMTVTIKGTAFSASLIISYFNDPNLIEVSAGNNAGQIKAVSLAEIRALKNWLERALQIISR